jgi:hypothetical protein
MKNPPNLKEMSDTQLQAIVDLTEARTLKISKDDLRLAEVQYMWSDELESEILVYWLELQAAWELYKQDGILPDCTCADHEGGFLAKEAYNPFYKYDEPCSLQHYQEWRESQDAASKV